MISSSSVWGSGTVASPAAGSPAADSPSVDSPAADSPSADSPPADSPDADSPPADSPVADSPSADSPAAGSLSDISSTVPACGMALNAVCGFAESAFSTSPCIAAISGSLTKALSLVGAGCGSASSPTVVACDELINDLRPVEMASASSITMFACGVLINDLRPVGVACVSVFSATSFSTVVDCGMTLNAV